MQELEERLKDLIISKYGTMLNFSERIQMSNSTLASIINRGINKASVNNIIKICNALSISADGLANGEIIPNNAKEETRWHFQDITEIPTFVKITLSSNQNITIDGEPLNAEDIMELYDHLELACEYLRRKTARRKKPTEDE